MGQKELCHNITSIEDPKKCKSLDIWHIQILWKIYANIIIGAGQWNIVITAKLIKIVSVISVHPLVLK